MNSFCSSAGISIAGGRFPLPRRNRMIHGLSSRNDINKEQNRCIPLSYLQRGLSICLIWFWRLDLNWRLWVAWRFTFGLGFRFRRTVGAWAFFAWWVAWRTWGMAVRRRWRRRLRFCGFTHNSRLFLRRFYRIIENIRCKIYGPKMFEYLPAWYSAFRFLTPISFFFILKL